MHLLKTESGGAGPQLAPPDEASSVPKILGGRPLPPPSMDHLDELEAQSIYILREAFARLKKLALLWPATSSPPLPAAKSSRHNCATPSAGAT